MNTSTYEWNDIAMRELFQENQKKYTNMNCLPDLSWPF